MKGELMIHQNPKSPIAEIFRTLRTNIQFMNTSKKVSSILITSTKASEGKTWIASNLAITFAEAGKKVILIDSDLRKGRLSKVFKVPQTPGLSNYLSSVITEKEDVKIDLTDYIRETELENLYLLPTGNIPPNPAELLSSEVMPQLLDTLKTIFDVVILDGTPGLLVTDAIILSRITDSTIIVAQHNSTRKDDITKVKKAVENVGGKITGVILNKKPMKQQEYYSSYYYGER